VGSLAQSILHGLVAGGLNGTTLYVLLVVFVATLIRSALGFGEALLAVPLLVLRIPLEIAAPLAVLISITIAFVVVAQDWRRVHMRSTGWLIFATLFGIPLGLLLLTSSHQRVVKAALAVVIIAFSAYSLIGDKPPELKADSVPWLLGCGFAAGVLGGAYGMNGPPLAIYGAMRPLVSAAVSGHVTRIFSSRKRRRNDWILAERTVGSGGNALFLAVAAGRGARHSAG
jgi:uncharacterized membrane protein YfcA